MSKIKNYDCLKDFLDDKYEDSKYNKLTKLKGVGFNERVKLECALRNSKNIETIEYLKLVYSRKIKNDDLKNYQTYKELLDEANKICFFFLKRDIECYNHELISKDLFNIFKYLIEFSNEINKKDISTVKEEKINENIIVETINDHEHTFFANKNLSKFKITNEYFYDSTNYYTEHHTLDNLEKRIESDWNNLYKDTDIELKNSNIYNNNVRLSLNLAMPEDELINIITELSKLYKDGKITKNINSKIDDESSYKIIAKKHLQPNYFSKTLFIYDMHHSDNEMCRNKEKLFEALGEKFVLSSSRVKNLSGEFKDIIEKQQYLQL